ncbi:MAG: hypothetical protein GF313_07555 [Caldithrix sp.]|nr:hypothetical protein [Caldithrix sp.]
MQDGHHPLLIDATPQMQRLTARDMQHLHTQDAVTDTINRIVMLFPDLTSGHDERILNKVLDMADSCGPDLAVFIRRALLESGVEQYQPQLEQVRLMTLHASKGLEFPVVFIVGCEDHLLPLRLFPGQEADEAEERRLLYVGMTRAAQRLYISYADKRELMGRMHRPNRSPFLDKIEEDLLQRESSDYRKPPKKDDNQLSLFE